MQNTIQREIIINASKERIYRAIATPEQVVLWFPETLDGDLAVGQQPILGFGEYGKNQIYIVQATPHDYFAYRWVPGANNFIGDVRSVPNTLVEFRIYEESSGSCKLVLTETGFAELPSEMMAAAFEQNSGGWDFMLGRLVTYLQP
ncbi:SRPBCC family protein [Paraglaciecola polaris]|uniref:Periplasmic protein thiol:disulfide oxidoreductase DsbE n=1 Tax=Paraglaciecola polaris LMG 21857 TaxID=1129793 RepID=K6YP93_9ALTE|nr:SRPBCC family protein [Paraglaciecola polaris]GAC34544.1 periplasmic protein thiol:disulfide oxidoreductase DsbE [Paraglaciecola polaris LMG 21857]|tara:strand:+ start:1188 stop:1625 length:438 start_codon:yes stop_codon:yes gene_type:complete